MSRSKQTAIVKPRPFTTPSVVNPIVVSPSVAKPSLMQTVKEGVGFGIGSAIGHRIIGGLFGPSSPQEPKRRLTEYEQCLAEHRDFGDSAAFCSYLLKAKDPVNTTE